MNIRQCGPSYGVAGFANFRPKKHAKFMTPASLFHSTTPDERGSIPAMKRLVRFAALTALGLGLTTLATEASAADHTLRIASLAPKNSSWGKVYAVWQKALEKKTDGKLEI